MLPNYILPSGTLQTKILKISGDTVEPMQDNLAVEEPLEIRLVYGSADKREQKNISVTMRTPGADADLAIGFLFTEGIIQSAGDIAKIQHNTTFDGAEQDPNCIVVELSNTTSFHLETLERNFYTTSSCGVCGKASIGAIKTGVKNFEDTGSWKIPASILFALPDLLRQKQQNFESTGGLHACAMFEKDGTFIEIREDVGRHNALDKLIGYCLQNGGIPLQEKILLLSGRASFELVQKAAMAGIQMICAVGAPSSLAVQTADEFGITLVGFLRGEKLNIYCGVNKIII